MVVKKLGSLRILLALAAAALTPVLVGQQAAKPLTNSDIIKMVKAGVPESVVISSIRSSPPKYDLSPDGLVALHKAGVTQVEMDAMMAAANLASNSVVTPAASTNVAPPPAVPAPSAPSPRPPSVAMILGGSPQEMPLERTQLAQTKQKPSSMSSLASDSALSQAMQAGINTSTMTAMSHVNSSAGGSALGQAGGVFAGMMSHRKPTVTYVWAIVGPASANLSPSNSPSFLTNFSSMLGVNSDEFEPAIVKLTPAQNSWRLVGATTGKEDAGSSPVVDWQIYSGFVEERVVVRSKKNGPGQYQISPGSPLLPGEYALVLRPVSKNKQFSGGDVARNQGDGIMFNAVWSFQVAAQ